MAVSEVERLKARLKKLQATQKKLERQAQLITTKLGKQERRADTRRKIIDGAHMQAEAETNPEIAALLNRLRREKVLRDDDRALFGLEPLSEAEKAARGFVDGKPVRRKGRKDDAVVAAVSSDNADRPIAPHVEARESENA